MHTPKRRDLALALSLLLACGASATAQDKPREPSRSSPAAAAKAPAADAVKKMIQGWPKTPKVSATMMIDKYGPPAEATPTRLVWFDNGPWKRTVVLKEETEHRFPMPHKDVMEQTVNYQVPPEKVAELARFDGSVYVDRTRGEMSARCDMEAANMIALNLAHDIVTGKRTVDQAREFYPQAMLAHLQKQPSPYAEKLMFSAQGDTKFPDRTTIPEQMVNKAEELKEAMIQQKTGQK